MLGVSLERTEREDKLALRSIWFPDLGREDTDWSKSTMLVSVSARHGSLQPGDQGLIEEKAAKLRRLYDRVNAIEVTVDLEHTDKPSVEIQVSVEHAGECVATAESSTVIAALDTAIPKVEQQLRRIKEKKTGHRATGHKHIETPTDEDE